MFDRHWLRSYAVHWLALVLVTAMISTSHPSRAAEPTRRTVISIAGDAFHINSVPTCRGVEWSGHRIDGLLMNSRMVQATFDDRNTETRGLWAYSDTQVWDADRNTREFIAAIPDWRRHGLLAVTLNLQGGSPQGYSKTQPWHNSAINADGSLDAVAMARLEMVLTALDEHGMVAILGLFYFGQDERISDEAAVRRAVQETLKWLAERRYRNVLIEVNNECNVRYDHAILKPDRIHELIAEVKAFDAGGYRYLAGTSYGGGTIPEDSVIAVSDFVLLHGNGVSRPERIGEMVRQVRARSSYRPKPILFNEDDHFDFDREENNFTAAVKEHASWGYFDYRMKGEGFDEGYQSVPVNWQISSERKRGFFQLLGRLTDAAPK
ncbi:MAG: hypothetical protein U0892_08520 [Pirellulales bacterium]